MGFDKRGLTLAFKLFAGNASDESVTRNLVIGQREDCQVLGKLRAV